MCNITITILLQLLSCCLDLVVPFCLIEPARSRTYTQHYHTRSNTATCVQQLSGGQSRLFGGLRTSDLQESVKSSDDSER
ncbi:hypothetical protein C8Q80DRAFT_495978 [Daedaleopsis nitida]|nr:hypothetical protein C8Q80DRAFT_495978 [Daedaleopsis nitida]